ncbi:MAG: RNA-binding S4 domain-containing protein [Flaviflexus sp.]|nr:RNA-binding S4 domain-containing protein [Flaviflexus sp.]
MSDIETLQVTTPIRLGQFLKLANLVGSGAEGAELIAAGEVTVDGETCTARGRQLTGGEVVEVGDLAMKVASR